MVNKIKELGLGVLASLIASYLFPLFPQFEDNINSKALSGINDKYGFLTNWIVFFILLIFVRWSIRKWIDKSQELMPLGFYVGSNYDIEKDYESHGFNWKFYADIRRKDYFSNEISGIHVGRVDGPYCKHDHRKMKESRTYFGRYKYKCPQCGYKKILLKNSWTLESDIKDEIEAYIRKDLKAN